MKMQRKLLVAAVAVALSSHTAMAAQKDNKKSDNSGFKFGVKAMSILGGTENGFDPTTGTGYLLKAKYISPRKNGVQFGGAVYNSGDLLGITDFNVSAPKKVGRGMFVDDEGKSTSQLGELYLDWKGGDHHVYGGRMKYKTPLTKAPSSLMPNFYTVVGADTKAIGKGMKIGIAQVTEMSFGARAMTEFGLIGEKTGTAGTATSPSAIGQAEFHNIGKTVLGASAKDTAGMTVLNFIYKPSKTFKLGIWDYYAHDIANTIYAEGVKTIPMQGKKLKISGQFLSQSEVGDKLYNNVSVSDAGQDLDYRLLGIKASLGNKKWGASLAYNSSSGDTKMLNAWGGDPAYTSTIFSRNAYRENVTAYKLGLRYKFAKGWMLKLGHANYGKSDTTKFNVGGGAQTEAVETDVVLVWKPNKNTKVKLFHANRTSEYDGLGGKESTMAHTRLVAIYNF